MFHEEPPPSLEDEQNNIRKIQSYQRRDPARAVVLSNLSWAISLILVIAAIAIAIVWVVNKLHLGL